jgi:hypothetical protein
MHLKKMFLILFCVTACFVTYARAAQDLQGTLTVQIAEDRAGLLIMYSVRNLGPYTIPPNPNEKYAYTIRNVQTGVEVKYGNLDSAFQTNVSQYVVGYGHAVFAVKKIAIPAAMKSNPGFYLIFLNCGPISNGEETVFYIPANLDNPNPVIRGIKSTVDNILTKVNALLLR